MMKARLERTFPNRMVLQTLSFSQLDDLPDLSLLISSYPLVDMNIPVVQVSPLLTSQDLEAVEQMLDLISQKPAEPGKEGRENFRSRMKETARWSQDCLEVEESFALIPTCAESTIADLIEQAACHSRSRSDLVKEALERRESLGSVISHDEGFGLLHASAPNLEGLEYFILIPEGKTFTSPELEGITFMAVSLMPDTATKLDREVLSALNSGLVTSESWLEALKTHNSSRAVSLLEELLETVSPVHR